MQPSTETEMPEEATIEKGVITISRPTAYFIVTAIVFFLLGYGVAWLSFDANTPEQTGIMMPDVDDDPALGPEDAPIVIVEFSDFRCPYCATFHTQTLYPLLEQYEGQIRFVYRDFPVVGGELAALASECADDQGVFWEYHELLFENQGALTSEDALIEMADQLEVHVDTFTSCLQDRVHSDEVEGDFADAVSYGLRGTPSFFINGRLIVGAQPLTVFVEVIEEILAE